MASRIAPRVPKGANLFELNPLQPGLFLKFSGGSILKRFVLINESARKRPAIFKRFLATLYEQYFEPLESMKQDDVNSNRRTRELVTELLTT